jgi:quercetin dioxygenase-like cupin family protein
MKKFNICEMSRGWFVGGFTPTAFDTEACEVAYKEYKPGDKEDRHFHKIATEITVITKGKVKMNDEIFEKGDIVVVYPNEAVSFEAIEDSSNVVVKLPGVLNDKYLV